MYVYSGKVNLNIHALLQEYHAFIHTVTHIHTDGIIGRREEGYSLTLPTHIFPAFPGDSLWPQACFRNLRRYWLHVQRTKLFTRYCKAVFVNGADVFPGNEWRTGPLRTKQLPHLKEPRKAYSHVYYIDIWATINISSKWNEMMIAWHVWIILRLKIEMHNLHD